MLFGELGLSGGGGVVLTLIADLAVRERHVAVLDHVTYLTLHGDQKQRDEVHDQYGPEHWYVEYGEECA